MAKRGSRTNGAERAFQIIECLVGLGVPATAYQVAKTLGAPFSSVYETIDLLERLDILSRKSEDGKVSLGPRLYFYGLSYLRGLDTALVYRREAENLCRLADANAQICVRDGDFMVVAAMCEGPDPYTISSRTGSRFSILWTASGRFLLHHLSLADIADIMSRTDPAPSGRGHQDPVAFTREAREAWERGYWIQTAESDFAIACVAAPVIDPEGDCSATICLLVPEKAAKDRGGKLGAMVMAAARNIEKNLGWLAGGPEEREPHLVEGSV